MHAFNLGLPTSFNPCANARGTRIKPLVHEGFGV